MKVAMYIGFAVAVTACGVSFGPSPYDGNGGGPGAAGPGGGGDADATADSSGDPSGGNGADGGGPSADGGTGGPGSGTGSGGDCLPPNVQSILQSNCASCHTTGSGGQPALLSYAALMTESPSYPGQTEAQRSLARIQDGTMPPGGALSGADVAVFAAWVNGGAKPVSCGGSTADGGNTTTGGDAATPPPPTDEFNTPIACTNGLWAGSNGSTMRPGEACLGSRCHSGSFAIGGTVFPTAHEKIDCYGVNGSVAGATVVVTDANNRQSTLSVNSAGNFYTQTRVTAPFSVKVVAAGKTRAMSTKLTAAMGDCNSCHTQDGTGNPQAPGRILIPK